MKGTRTLGLRAGGFRVCGLGCFRWHKHGLLRAQPPLRGEETLHTSIGPVHTCVHVHKRMVYHRRVHTGPVYKCKAAVSAVPGTSGLVQSRKGLRVLKAVEGTAYKVLSLCTHSQQFQGAPTPGE